MGAPPEVCITVFSGSYGRINIPQLHHVGYVCFWGTPVVPCLAPRYAQRGGGGGHWGLRCWQFSCGISVILILNCGILQTCGMRFFAFWTVWKIIFQVLQLFRAFSSLRSFHFFLIFSQPATGCYLFCLFCLNQTFPNLDFCFRVFALNLMYSVVVSIWHRVSTAKFLNS